MLTPAQIQSVRENIGITPQTIANSQNPQPSGQDLANHYLQVAGQGKTQDSQEPGLGSRIGNDISNSANQMRNTFQQGVGGQQSRLRSATGVVAEAFNAVPKVASEFLPKPIRSGIDTAAAGIGKGLKWFAENTTPQFLVDFVTKHPDAANKMEDILGTLSNTGQISGDILIADQAAKGLQKGVDLTKKAGQKIGETVSNVTDKISSKFGGGNSVEDVNQRVWDMVQPKLNAKGMTSAVKAGNISQEGMLKTTTLNPSKFDQEMVDAVAPYVADAKDPLEAVQNMSEAVDEESNRLIEGVKDQGGTWTGTQMKGAVDEASVPIGVKGVSESQVQGIKDYVGSLSEDAPKDASGALRVAKDFRQTINSEFGQNIWSKDTPIASYIRNVNKSLNDFAAGTLPEEGTLADGTKFVDSLRKQTLLYRAIDNVAPKVGKVGQNVITRAIASHPVFSGVAKTAARAAGFGAAVKLGEDIIP